jgi:biopolymer transport protein ExbB/TolQ
MSISAIYSFVGNLTYGALAAVALWGLYCIVMILARIKQLRFRSEGAQEEFLSALEVPLSQGRFDEAYQLCEGDTRAVCRLAAIGIENRRIGYEKVKQLIVDRFQRDILADLEHRLSWVNTVIKSAPMLGLFGTVLGMMGAFGKLSVAENVKPEQLASDIMLALITTACGLSIAIPLVLAVTMINVRMQKLEDLTSAGLTRFLEIFRHSLATKQARAG